jgi:putative heme-binding domain-containing protein
LDNWIYGANGLIGGAIQSFAGGPPANIRGRDFRCDPLTGVFEPASGLTQQGRVRDDWGNWFGCDNSTLLWFYPLADHYVRRNPHAAPPELRVPLVVEPDGNLIHPISRTLERFNDPGHANRVTSACGLGLYRDVLLGDAFYNNAFICEPVHNLVHRRALSNQGVTFAANRASEERESEFLASKDNWFRPVQARTGRDGALWIVDMYRFVVEHPRWITPERLAELDLRAGQDKGRIYRIRPRTQPLRPVRNLTELPAAELARALDHPNGTERDLIHLELLRRKDSAAIAPLRNLAASNARPFARLQALAVLDGLNALPEPLLLTMLHDSDAGVREQAVRISERFKPSGPLIESLLALVPDPNSRVRFQLALSLGNRTGSQITSALARLARSPAEPWIEAAVISSTSDQPGILLEDLLARPVSGTVSTALISKLTATAIGTGQPEQIQAVLRAVAPSNPGRPEPWEPAALEELLRAAQPTGASLASLAGADAASSAAVQRIEQTLELQRRIASNPNADEAARNGAVRLLGFQPVHEPEDAQLLLSLLRQTPSDELRKSIFRALERLKAPGVASDLLGLWPQLPPSVRARTIDLLLRREAWLDALLGGVENGAIQPVEFAPGQRQALLKNPRVASRAEPLFRAPSASRSQVVEQFSAALRLAGDAVRGAEQFRQLCANCHVWRDQGVAVGPNLAALTDRTPQFLLTAILDPNAAVENRYLNYQVDLTDGRSLSGIISAESASSLTLLTSGAAAETLLRSSIAGLRASNLSLMPEGLEQGRTAQDLADLIAYLKL